MNIDQRIAKVLRPALIFLTRNEEFDIWIHQFIIGSGNLLSEKPDNSIRDCLLEDFIVVHPIEVGL
jgi:hypothetical protein